jgi:lactose/L-arabinose transport system substrate-binding protein
MKSFRMLFCAALVLTLVLVTGACSKSQSGSAPAERSGADGGKTIVVWTWFTEQMKARVIPAFEAKTGYKVEGVTIPSGEIEQKLTAALAAGFGAPDVSGMQGDSIQRFIKFGGLADLSGYMADLKDSFPAYKIANNTAPDGKIYGSPIDSGPCATFYLSTAFEEAGVDPASMATWDGYIEAGKKLREKGYFITNMPVSGDVGWIRMLVQQQGGSFFTPDGKPTLNTPEFINALRLYKRIFDAGITADLTGWTGPYAEAIIAGQVVTIVNAAWYMNVFIHSFDGTQGKGWQIMEMPQWKAGEHNSSNLGGSELVIPDQIEDKDAAWAFVKFYNADIAARKIAMEDLGEFPAYLPLYQDPEVQNKTSPFFGDQKVFAFFADMLPLVPAKFLTLPALGEVQDAIGAALPALLDGSLPPEALASRLQAEAEQIVANQN